MRIFATFILLVSAVLPMIADSVGWDRSTFFASQLLCEASYTCRGGSAIEKRDHQVESIRDRFNRDGYIVLKDFLAGNEKGDSLVPLLEREWHDFSIQYWTRIFEVLHAKGHISQPRHVMNEEYCRGKLRQPGYKEIVHRNPGRYELSLNSKNSTDEHEQERTLLHDGTPSLQPIIEQLEPVILSILKQHPNYKEEDDKKYNLLYSMLISAPGSENQQFHFDTRHVNEKEHWPAHIINVFIPLVNITTTDLGPTELVPQSHKETRLLQNPATRSQAKPFLSPVSPLLNVGDVLMFDFRILHRGMANMRNINRPMLVLAFSVPSFHDTANWPGPSIFE